MPVLEIDLDKIAANSRLVAGMLEPHGVGLVGVTKACLGNVEVGRAMLAGGAAALADSRPASVARLRRQLPGACIELLRTPVTGSLPAPGATAGAQEAGVSGGSTPEPATLGADVYFVSSFDQARALLLIMPGGADRKRPVQLCLMIETGDGREGVPAAEAPAEAARLATLDGAVLAGLATNAACARPQAPLEEALEAFAAAARAVKAELEAIPDATGGAGAAGRINLEIMSAGGSGLLGLLPGVKETVEPAELFAPLTELRCGEALLLGRIPSGVTPGLFLPGAHRDAFVLEAPVLEVFEKEGRVQALVELGVQDAGHGPLISLDPGITPARITSDYLVVECARHVPPAVGAAVSFIPTYYALLAAMTSPFVEKSFR